MRRVVPLQTRRAAAETAAHGGYRDATAAFADLGGQERAVHAGLLANAGVERLRVGLRVDVELAELCELLRQREEPCARHLLLRIGFRLWLLFRLRRRLDDRSLELRQLDRYRLRGLDLGRRRNGFWLGPLEEKLDDTLRQDRRRRALRRRGQERNDDAERDEESEHGAQHAPQPPLFALRRGPGQLVVAEQRDGRHRWRPQAPGRLASACSRSTTASDTFVYSAAEQLATIRRNTGYMQRLVGDNGDLAHLGASTEQAPRLLAQFRAQSLDHGLGARGDLRHGDDLLTVDVQHVPGDGDHGRFAGLQLGNRHRHRDVAWVREQLGVRRVHQQVDHKDRQDVDHGDQAQRPVAAADLAVTRIAQEARADHVGASPSAICGKSSCAPACGRPCAAAR